MKRASLGRTKLGRPQARAVLARLIDAPNLVQTVRALPPTTFAALVRHVGVEDAGELVALATTPQLVAAFDQDLFVNEQAGEREVFDRTRFVTWLEVLLEAGDAVAAARVADLSEEFVVHALSSILLVLDDEALRERMSEGGYEADIADKAIEGCLSEEIDGYLLLSKDSEGWDAALALILALDRDHRAFLERVLDRAAALSSHYVDDLEALTEVLSDSESLAEDVEAEREERRAEQGYVEPRAARAFLTLAREALSGSAESAPRDALTKSYFRSVGTRGAQREPLAAPEGDTAALLQAIEDVVAGEALGARAQGAQSPARGGGKPEQLRASEHDRTGVEGTSEGSTFGSALRLLAEQDARAFGARMEELAYLANVLVAGADRDGVRFEPAEAAEAAMATVGFGAELEARGDRKRAATVLELCVVLRTTSADALFRRASSILFAAKSHLGASGYLLGPSELTEALEQLSRPQVRSGDSRK
jgi:hypothetical protein